VTLKKELFFPTPIYFKDLDDSQSLNQFLKTRIYAWRDQDKAGIVRSNARDIGAWHSPTTMNVREEFQLFVTQVDTCVNELYADQMYSREYQSSCLNMWANINQKSGYNRSHIHPGSLWSGVYYVQTPKDCGRIIFQEPRPQAQILQPAQRKDAEQAAEHWSEVFHEAIAGRLILFPSWLRHEVEPNMSSLAGPTGDRISVSFNYIQKPLN